MLSKFEKFMPQKVQETIKREKNKNMKHGNEAEQNRPKDQHQKKIPTKFVASFDAMTFDEIETKPKPKNVNPSSTKPSHKLKKEAPKTFDFIAFLETYFDANAQFRERWIKANIEDNTLVPFFENMFASFCNILMTANGKECRELLMLIEKCMSNPWFQQPFSIALTQYNNNNKINKAKSTQNASINSTDIFKEMIKIVIWKDWQKLEPSLEEIFTRICEKPNFSNFFAALFIALHEIESAMEKDVLKLQIHKTVLRMINEKTEKCTVITKNDAIQVDKNQGKEDEKKQFNDALNKQLSGTLKLVSNLFINKFVNFKVCEICITVLLQNAEKTGNEEILENLIEFMKEIGKIEQNANLDGYINQLAKCSPNVSGKIGIKILELMSLRDKKWIQEEEKISA